MYVNFKEKIFRLPKDSTFVIFKHEILKKENLLIKNFLYNERPIKEKLLLKNYDKFTCEMDPNEFDEYKENRYRCKNCLKYFKETEWKCSHTEKCKAQYKFKKKLYNKFEEAIVNLEEDEKDEEKTKEENNDKMDKEIDKTIGKPCQKRRSKILSILNKILHSPDSDDEEDSK